MSSSITQATFDHLARRLDELAAEFPTGPEAVDLVTLTDDIGTLAHHLQQATERAQERFTAPATVHPLERAALVRLTRATAGIPKALDILAEALTYATTGFQREAVADLAPSHLRNDPEVLRIMTAEKYAEASARLRETAAALRPTPGPAAPSPPRSAVLRTHPPAQSHAAPPHPLATRDHSVLALPPALPTPPGAAPARR
ncbi:hypothetical protein [Streptomyces chromofuscus]|uniref:Uncharacterized protein n=1 Tax=Streptomyces chromofuscus TaxID=42881 RepID=A0A7M2T2U1_STRCW|nr:hypothetical protein [Streptomyces chromofuscus]QOV43000.1 hypothetical protein IPT68_24900 [Streptomyces chromofuscus]GGS92866.1 hypothetical protein GCM10010254_10990 [Streptomyces chromofuscus]